MSEIEFKEFPKIPRLNRPCFITEKIDGTNGQIIVGEDGSVTAAFRSRLLLPGQTDNFGFAKWVADHEEELKALGPGRHFGEWWGCGIQRNYGLNERRFSLFNVDKWTDPAVRPTCCHVVPTLWQGVFDSAQVRSSLEALSYYGSSAAPGFMKPEGIVVYHVAAGKYFKATIENDDEPKGAVSEQRQ